MMSSSLIKVNTGHRQLYTMRMLLI